MLRLGLAAVLMVWNIVGPASLYLELPAITAKIVENVVPDRTASGVRAITTLRWNEISYLAFFVLATGMIEYGSEAVTSVMLLEVPSGVQLILVTGGLCTVVGALLWNIYAQPVSLKTAVEEEATRQPQTKVQGLGFTRGWLLPTGVMALLASCGAVSMRYIDGLEGIYLACLLLLPVGALQTVFRSAVDAFLLQYDAQRSSDLVYWQNVLQVLVSGPLVALNWMGVSATGCDDEPAAEVGAASVVLGISAAFVTALFLYYAFVDKWLPSRLSLRSMVQGAAAPEERDPSVAPPGSTVQV
eukprot:TRINITY_DN14392_c0_g1_i2.p2 TRINITY_DN14392_c0_g1~~TRINITY_DN14392_c0_g1_i2.p2  ORF type:complete len:300 (+),score=53.19 TRINITY_DN14392_c0_g1_i2:893-1792(+)